MKAKLIRCETCQFFILGGVFIKAIRKNILCFILATSILITSVTVSYTNPISIVKANEIDDIENIVNFVLGVCLTVGGATVSGGALPVIEVIGLALQGYSVGEMLVDNGDGTVTINGKLIQDVIDEFELMSDKLGFCEGNVNYMLKNSDFKYSYGIKGYGDFGTYTEYCNYSGSFTQLGIGRYYCGILLNPYSSGGVYFTIKDNRFTRVTPNISGECYRIYSNGQKIDSTMHSQYVWYSHDGDNIIAYANFPIFDSEEKADTYLKDGTGYKDAVNYKNVLPNVRRSSSYNRTYNGGNITVNKNKLPNVINQIDVLNNKYPDDSDTDKIINEFNIWLYSDDDEPETETPIEPDTSEVGNDLTETNGWLKKIYNRIGEFMNSFSSQKNKLNKLLESKFDELITAVKNIGKSNEPETEPETETETETETSTDKTDIIIDNQEKSQGILESILTAIHDGFKDTVNELKKIRRWTALDTIFDGLDAVADWLDFVTKFFDNVTDGIGLLVSGFADTVTELTKVFPFSIPITLVLIVKMFSAPPEAPKFELPLKLDAFNIDEKIVIDLSQFQVISVISRTFLTIIYCVGLYHLTFKIISAKKGG